jgi:hypothetical protein
MLPAPASTPEFRVPLPVEQICLLAFEFLIAYYPSIP